MRHLLAEEADDLQWLYNNPPEAKLAALKEENNWDRRMEEYSVYTRDQSGKCIFAGVQGLQDRDPLR